MDEEQYLRNQLRVINEDFKKQAKPIIDKLLAIESIKRPNFVFSIDEIEKCFVPVISDTDRINAIGEQGFAVWQIIENGNESWRCVNGFSDLQFEGKTLR